MTSRESNNSDAIETNSIRIEIAPDPIVLIIPEEEADSNILIPIDIRIINSTSTTVRFYKGNFTPEIVGANSQQLKGRPRHPAEFLEYELMPRQDKLFIHSVKLCWRKYKLQLRIYWWNSRYLLWTFDGLQPGTYQLRFIFDSNAYQETESVELSEKTPTGKLATEFVNLYLVHPVEPEGKAVEVDGIRFETIVPEPVLTIPKNQPDATTPVQFGIRVTNLSLTPYRFMFHSVMPELLREDGQLIKRTYGRNITIPPDESDFFLVMPQESFAFFVDSELYWHGGTLHLRGREGSGGWWHFQVQPGIYYVRFIYRRGSPSRLARVMARFCPEEVMANLLENLWTGIVPTPPVEFHLVQLSLEAMS